jgi:V/A-type H+-transporting ATPase subunit E
VLANGGKSGITNTLAGRLERVKGELAPQISRLLAE